MKTPPSGPRHVVEARMTALRAADTAVPVAVEAKVRNERLLDPIFASAAAQLEKIEGNP